MEPSPEKPRSKPLNAFYIILSGSVIGLIFGTLYIIFVFGSYAEISLVKFDYTRLTQLRPQYNEIVHSFAALRALGGIPCSTQYLASMRAIVFGTSTVRDASYQPTDTIACSSGLGVIDISPKNLRSKPIRTPDGFEVWEDQEWTFAPGVQSDLVKDGPYQLLVNPGVHPLYSEEGVAITTLKRTADGHAVPVQGPIVSPSSPELVDGRQSRSGLSLTSTACPHFGLFCYLTTAGPSDVLRIFGERIAAALIASCLSGAVLALGLSRVLTKWFSLESRLRRALRDHDLQMEYQPIVDAQTLEITGAEALMRWKQRSGKSVAPDEFVPVAEASGLAIDLTCYAISKCALDLGKLLRSRQDFTVSINVTPTDLTNPRFRGSLDHHMINAGIPASKIAFELTERQSMYAHGAIDAINVLRDAGHPIYIDDFGTGHSNISYLADMHFDKLKIDKLFVQSIGKYSLRSRAIKMILEIATEMGADTVAEGVETVEQVEWCRELGIGSLQGYFISRPTSALNLLQMVASSPPYLG